MTHLYEVTTPQGKSKIIDAACSQKAKKTVYEQLELNRWYNDSISSMKANRINVDYPEVDYQPCNDDEYLLKYNGKDIVIYDEHHGTAIRIKKATVASLQYFLDNYTSIIILE